VDTQQAIRDYVENRLEALSLTQEEACKKAGIPRSLLNSFLEDLDLLNYAELLRVIIMFGSVLGSPDELATVCGIESDQSDTL
jgi:predicted transcriptional regulator